MGKYELLCVRVVDVVVTENYKYISVYAHSVVFCKFLHGCWIRHAASTVAWEVRWAHRKRENKMKKYRLLVCDCEIGAVLCSARLHFDLYVRCLALSRCVTCNNL